MATAKNEQITIHASFDLVFTLAAARRTLHAAVWACWHAVPGRGKGIINPKLWDVVFGDVDDPTSDHTELRTVLATMNKDDLCVGLMQLISRPSVGSGVNITDLLFQDESQDGLINIFECMRATDWKPFIAWVKQAVEPEINARLKKLTAAKAKSRADAMSEYNESLVEEVHTAIDVLQKRGINIDKAAIQSQLKAMGIIR